MKYQPEYEPPAPALTVKLTRPLSSQSATSRAKLDTGADITVVPQRAVNELSLVPARRLTVASFDGREEPGYTYFVDISFDRFIFPTVEALSARRSDVLLGRDVLNMLKATLDGKNLSFELLDP
ncbi:MAG: retroviral-like aspartic protease family protein [Candidatus Bathyarchaeia archaeon]